MSETVLVKHCAPTLAGLKTANMFSYMYSDREEMRSDITELDRSLSEKGIRAVPLNYSAGRALIYIFRPEELERDLAEETAAKILKERGYEGRGYERCLASLARRFRDGSGFPHEVGLFLGYPPEDVEGFLKDSRRDVKCVGSWKVYGDEEKARRKFDQYEKCEKAFTMLCQNGRSAAELAVRKRPGV